MALLNKKLKEMTKALKTIINNILKKSFNLPIPNDQYKNDE